MHESHTSFQAESAKQAGVLGTAFNQSWAAERRAAGPAIKPMYSGAARQTSRNNLASMLRGPYAGGGHERRQLRDAVATGLNQHRWASAPATGTKTAGFGSRFVDELHKIAEELRRLRRNETPKTFIDAGGSSRVVSDGMPARTKQPPTTSSKWRHAGVAAAGLGALAAGYGAYRWKKRRDAEQAKRSKKAG